ncbi:hypothetical protein [Ktedonospora formicarum]|uniref:hypothetical protein n=1 Tax=Ktedonospora formicarum TaxID=2778364 RepID=UPI001C69430E|nr:hypothetical protein [Ktedonospora formicarum]
MDATTAITSMNETTHLLMTWTLVGLLLAWMIVFSWLALRKGARQAQLAAIPATTPTPTPASTAPTKLHIIAAQPTPANPLSQGKEPTLMEGASVVR